jgi:hypothetical protein
VGFCCVDVDGVPPGKDQFHCVGLPVDKSKNVMENPAQITFVSASNAATGACENPTAERVKKDKTESIFFMIYGVKKK